MHKSFPTSTPVSSQLDNYVTMTRTLEHTSATCNFPRTGNQVGATFGDKMGGIKKWCEEEKVSE